MSLRAQNNKKTLTVREMAVFSMLGAIMFCSKIVMELLPNIHLVGVLVVVYTVVYRKKALVPLYIYVAISGVYAGFSIWWIPYLYIWTVLWGAVMLLPKKMKKRAAAVVYPLICSLHGLLYGTLYAPVQAIAYGLGFDGMIAWIVAGLPYDALHAAGNLTLGFLILPLSELLRKLERN